MQAISEVAHTAGKSSGQPASPNPVACDNGQVLYNLNLGSFEFSVQTTDSAVSCFTAFHIHLIAEFQL